MPRVRKNNYASGLFVVGAREAIPADAVRRLECTSPNRVGGVRSRLGSTQIGSSPATPAHSLFRYNQHRYAGVSSSLIRADTGSVLKTGLSGSLWRFAKMPPVEGQNDWMFVARAGPPFKVGPTDTVENWGIAAPPDGIAATLGTQRSHQVQSFDPGFAAGLLPYAIEGSAPTFSDDTVAFQEGTGSLKGIFPASQLNGFFSVGPFDLTKFTGGSTAGDEDFIAMWIRIDNPTNVEYVTLAFDVDDGVFDKNYYTRTFNIVATQPLSQDKLKTQTFGLNDFLDPSLEQVGATLTSKQTNDILDQIGQTDISVQPMLWVRLQIPKSTFFRVGSGTQVWDNVQSFGVLVKTSARGGATVWFDDLTMIGGAGLQGSYQYVCTFRNDNLGTRSNANPTPAVVDNVQRQQVNLSSIPVSADSQVTHVEIWRTIGNGSFFFFAFMVSNGTTTASDSVADYYGLDTRPGAVVLGIEQLPTFNFTPNAVMGSNSVIDVVGPWQERLWLISKATGMRGRIYFSAAGLPESIEGFITPSGDDDAMQKLVIWNNALYAFSQRKMFQVLGTDQPFTYQEVFGAPGTTRPDTVVATSSGILAFAQDESVRKFNGTLSVYAGYPAMGALFRGSLLENSASEPNGYFPTAGFYGRDDYYMIDASAKCFAMSTIDDTWREEMVAIHVMYYEPDTREWLASITIGGVNYIVLWETIGAFDDVGNPIAYAVETGDLFADVVDRGVLQYVFIDINPNGQTLTPYLTIDYGTPIALPVITGVGRQPFEVQVGRDMRSASILVAGNLTAEVLLYRIEADIYVPMEVPREIKGAEPEGFGFEEG